MNLLLYDHNGFANRAPYVTANVNLWPQMDVLVANPDRLAALSDQQRGWLEQAAHDATERSVGLADHDAQSLKNACKAGARFANASKEDLAALRDDFASVYASLEQDVQTKAFIGQIQELNSPHRQESRWRSRPAAVVRRPRALIRDPRQRPAS